MALRFKIPWQKWTYFDINPINCYVAISSLQYFMLVVIDLINVPCKTESIGMRYCAGITTNGVTAAALCRIPTKKEM